MRTLHHLAGLGCLLAVFALAPAAATAGNPNQPTMLMAQVVDVDPVRWPDCSFSWMSKGSAAYPDPVRFLGERHIGDLLYISVLRDRPAPIGMIQVASNAARRCEAHVLLRLQAPGLEGNLEISEIHPSPSDAPQRACTFAADNGPIIDAQASGLCIPLNSQSWVILLPRPYPSIRQPDRQRPQ